MQLAQDIRYALRQLRRNQAFALTAILTLALGIGATTAVFSVVEQMLLTELPYHKPEQIVALQTLFTDRQHQIPRVTGGDYLDMQAQSAFSSAAYYAGFESGVQLPDHAAYTHVTIASPHFLEVFGVQPVRGTLFGGADATHQALVSEAFADAELGGVDRAVGRLVSMEGTAYEVIGVIDRKSVV